MKYSILIIVIAFFACNRPSFQKESLSEDTETKVIPSSPFQETISVLESLTVSDREKFVIQLLDSFPHSPVIESDSIVSLYFYGKAKQVLINGDLQQGWSLPDTLKPIPCGDSTFFHITYSVPTDSRLDYQFVIDETFTTDPLNPAITPSGYGPHSEIAMPGFTPDPTRLFRESVPHGTIDSIVFSSKDTLIKSRLAMIYLPPNYAKLKYLPVIYVMDGLEAMEYMSYLTVLDNMITEGRIGPMMAVFIPPAQRHIEYLGELQPAFTSALCNEFVPVVDRKYRTSPQPEKRGITGISSGGHFALITVLSRPDVFLYGAGQSPTLSDDLYDALLELKKKNLPLTGMKIYLDVGKFDLVDGTVKDLIFLDAVKDFNSELEKARISQAFQVYNDGHEWANWRERTDDILVYFFGLKE